MEPRETTIRSLHDQTPLKCRIYLPTDLESPWLYDKGAIVAHPYAPLGGSYDDHVVLTIVNELTAAGYYVITFNFRSGISIPFVRSGTTLSAKAEQADYETIRIFLVYFLKASRRMEPVITTKDGSASDPLEPMPLNIILAGYSYGSMIASRMSPLQGRECIKELTNEVKTTPLSELLYLAVIRAMGMTGPDARTFQPAELDSSLDLPINYSYLLVSPVLPPVSWALAPRLANPFAKGMEAAVEDRLVESKSLAVYGGHDQFAGREKLTEWAESLAKRKVSKFTHVLVDDADHFWISRVVRSKLQSTVRSWIEDASP